jgi:hypothetical protein
MRTTLRPIRVIALLAAIIAEQFFAAAGYASLPAG